MDEKELTKLKVAELQAKLKEQGLPTTGKKAELIARLLEANEALAEETEPAAEETAADEAAIEESVEEEVAESTTVVEEDVSAEVTTEDSTKADGAPKSTVVTAKQTDDEARKARAARFGTALGDDTEKLAKRANRFGLPLKDPNAPAAASNGNGGAIGGKKNMTAEEIERLKKRQERFGVVTSKTLEKVVSKEQKQKEAEAKKRRLERFGGGAAGTPQAEEILRKKKARAERFGLSVEVKKGTADPEQAAKLAARAKKFGL